MDFSLLAISALSMVLVDAVYLNSVTGFFNKQIMSVQGSPIKVDLLGAIVSYCGLILGLYYFILREGRGAFDAFILGLVIYMVYEGTSKALLKNWKWSTVLVDGVWGGILFALTTVITYKLRELLM